MSNNIGTIQYCLIDHIKHEGAVSYHLHKIPYLSPQKRYTLTQRIYVKTTSGPGKREENKLGEKNPVYSQV